MVQPSPELTEKIKTFGKGLSAEQKEQFTEILTEYSIEKGRAIAREMFREAKNRMFRNLKTLLD
jgi:hypothetical protein